MSDTAIPADDLLKLGSVNRFGSLHTTQKLEALEKYLHAYTTALKKQSFTLHYLDAFAGTGQCEIKIGDGKRTIPGSAHIAIECNPPFNKLVFIEKSGKKVRALRQLKQTVPTRDIAVLHDDANVELPKRLDSLDQKSDRAIVFLDPFGMQVEWATLERIAATKIVDLLYLFPLSALYRQATRNADKIDSDKEASIIRILGTREWRNAFYEPPSQPGLFWQDPDVRTKNVEWMVNWVKRRLETVFPAVADPMILRQVRKDGKHGPANFALFFAISNPSKPAIGLALRLANAVLKQ